MNWDDIRLFNAIAEHGSFRAAADATGVGHTTLSRRMDALEKQLGARLFNRGPKGLSLTPTGEEVLLIAAPVDEELARLQHRVHGSDRLAQGHIRLTVPAFLLDAFLADALMAFCQNWPDITLEIDTSLTRRDLSGGEADIAVRLTNHPPAHLVGRRLGRYMEAAYASRSYLESLDTHSHHHTWISPGLSYRFNAQLMPEFHPRLPLKAQLLVPEIHTQLQAAERGYGVATLPCVAADQTELVRISDSYQRAEIWLLSHPQARDNKRMQVLRECLVNAFSAVG